MAFYPSVTASVTAKVELDTFTAADLTQIQDEIVAYQNEWGLEPKSTSTDTAARLDTIKDKLNFSGLNTATSISDNDKFIVYDVDSTTAKEIEHENLVVSYLRLYNHAGYGSSATAIPYFSVVDTDSNQSSSWTYANTSTSGLEINITSDGHYAVTFTFSGLSGMSCGISLNASSTTAHVSTLVLSSILSIYNNNKAVPVVNAVFWSGHLSDGDIIRPHANAVGPSSNSETSFSIVRIS